MQSPFHRSEKKEGWKTGRRMRAAALLPATVARAGTPPTSLVAHARGGSPVSLNAAASPEARRRRRAHAQ